MIKDERQGARHRGIYTPQGGTKKSALQGTGVGRLLVNETNQRLATVGRKRLKAKDVFI